MTALCGGGTSSSKAGVAETIIFTAGSLSSLLNNKGGYWATLAAPLLGVLAYSATDLCTTDPPSQPTISDDEYTALLQLQPWDTLTSALAKLADIVTRIVWFDMCECDSPPQPILPISTLDPPADVFLPNYGGGDCPRPNARLNVPINGSGNVHPFTNVTAQLFPGLTMVQSATTSGYDIQDIAPLPTNWTTLRTVADYVSGTTVSPQSYHVDFNVFDASRVGGGSIASSSVTSTGTPHGVSAASPISINTGLWKYFAINAFALSPITVPGVVDYEVQLGCAGTAPQLSGCCSDPTVIALLSQLMQQVNLVQRQNAPFAYVPGNVHAALTGTGEISVQGLLGALVEITDSAANVGAEAGTPELTFEAGWISWGNADGFIDREFISNETLISLPALAGQFTRIGYTLAVGVEISVTELIREP